uniref:Adenylosuccinate lyase n=1 Tax=uncultured Armatimonadetes bacterium TaxID=157466 RepID=A0A6J4HR70_9BACT|nr:Adenylosuccinate lyase @ SAICAR lyase [uncultured Armatimonadetes bacterium]
MSLKALSPLDGRYEAQTSDLAPYFSEWALIRFRVLVETEWLLAQGEEGCLTSVRGFTRDEADHIRRIASTFDDGAAARVKEIERTTNHDVKAVEYFVKERLDQTPSLRDVREWVHFGCTSEDINNLAHALMLKGGVENVWLPQAGKLVDAVRALAEEHGTVPMLSHTHGQPASPTTVGKELAVFVYRWERALRQVRAQEYLGKFNGAVGNFNAHAAAYPDAPWEEIARRFVTRLGLVYNPLTTQIEPHDYLAECFHALIRFNNVTLDFDRDVWAYISAGYFKQRPVAGEVGSSTMPHKVNPIDFENSEANLGLSNAVLEHLANKLPVSRLQRDLSDSSALRSMGGGVAHSLLALKSSVRGLGKLSVDTDALQRDLDANWEVLGEAVQTVMRKAGHDNPYEQLKEFTRGARITPDALRAFIADLDLETGDKQRLLAMTPATYVGLAARLVKHVRPD